MQGADLSDVLMDRAVINGANLKQANLSRAVFTRSDFGGADITGADFTNALVDRTQQIVSANSCSSTASTTTQQLQLGLHTHWLKLVPDYQHNSLLNERNICRRSVGTQMV